VKTTFYPNKIFTFASERNVAFDSEDREEDPVYDREENPFLLEGIRGLPENLQARIDDTAVFAYYGDFEFPSLLYHTGYAASRGAGSRARYPKVPENARFVWLIGNSADALVEAAEEEGAKDLIPIQKMPSYYDDTPFEYSELEEFRDVRVRYMKGNGPFGYALILFDGYPRTAKAFAEYLELLFGSFVDIYFVEGEDDSDFPEDPAPRSRREARDTGFKRTRRI